MAAMINSEDLREFKKKNPGVPVVSYVNTTADVKAESDICCTSSNAVKIVKSIKENSIIFTPDKNLAGYISTKVDKKIISWPGFCPIHDSINAKDVIKARELHPAAVFMAHPECRAEVLELADYVVSTGQMFDVVSKENAKLFLIGTEEGLIYPLKQRFPDREFVPVKTA